MNNSPDNLFPRYAAALSLYLGRPEETMLHQAYELGRAASARGMGVLDIARLHHRAVLQFRWLPPQAVEGAETFFLEALSPFEAAHRGFREANLELHQLSRRIFRSQEEERKRISRELHDEVGQALTAVATRLALVPANGSPADDSLRQWTAETQQLLTQTMEAVHRFARELRPAMLDDLGLLPALRSYVKAFARRTGLPVRLKGCAAAERLNDEQKTAVYRVAQEGLTNVARHARASKVELLLSAFRGGVRMELSDNGRAFNASRCLDGKNHRLGLLGMQERVGLVNGRFRLDSRPGRGTTVIAEFPFVSKPLEET